MPAGSEGTSSRSASDHDRAVSISSRHALVTTPNYHVGRSRPTGTITLFHTDAEGRYIKDGSADGELNPRLHGLLRSDANGRYQYETIRPGSYNNNAAHVHYVVRAPGYKAQLLDLWFQDDPILAARRKAGLPEVPPAIAREAVAIRPLTRNATGVWHATRDIAIYRD
jgi:protocatechuate 3,4-dioxygenase beta subunit